MSTITMNKFNKLNNRLNKLQSNLSIEYFGNEKPTFKDDVNNRASIYNLEKDVDLISKVVIVQSCARRWLATIKIYKLKQKIRLAHFSRFYASS